MPNFVTRKTGFKGDKVTFLADVEGASLNGSFKLDPTKKPKTIDYTFTGGPTKGQVQLGIYELDGERVKFCFAAPGKDRPTEFTTKEGSARTLSVWKREQKSP